MRTPARAAAALALLLAGCPARAGREKRGPVHFLCEDGSRFAVLFERDLARLVVGDDSRVLARVQSASGARYTDGHITLFTKGRDAMVEQDGAMVYRNCRAVPPPEG